MISKDGRIVSAQAFRGDPRLRAAVEAALMEWTFDTSKLAPQAGHIETVLPFEFRKRRNRRLSMGAAKRRTALVLSVAAAILLGLWLHFQEGKREPAAIRTSGDLPTTPVSPGPEAGGAATPQSTAVEEKREPSGADSASSAADRTAYRRVGDVQAPRSDRSVEVFGRVTIGKKPVSGYRVGFAKMLVKRQDSPPERVATQSDGSYRIELPAPGVYWVSVASAHNPEVSLSSTQLALTGRKDRTRHDIHLPGLANLNLQVVKPDGSSVAGAEVLLAHRTVAGWRKDNLRTESDGWLSLTLAPGQYFISSQTRRDNLHGQLSLDLAESEARRVQLRLKKPPAIVQGQVFDRAGGLGVADVRLTLLKSSQRHPDPSMPSQEAFSDSQGRFAMPVQETGSFYVSARGWGYLEARSADFEVSQSTEVVGPLTIPLERGLELFGLVLDSQGREASGAEVRLRSAATGRVSDTLTRCNQLGEFLFVGLSAGTVRVSADLDGNSAGPIDVELPIQSPLILQLEASSRIEGEFLHVDGRPVVQPFRIILIRQAETFSIENIRPFLGPYQNNSGRFELEGIEPGRYILQITALEVDESGASRESKAQSEVFEVTPGQTARVRVTLG